MFLVILTSFMTIVLIMNGFVIYKLGKRLLEFDELFELFQDDIDTNIRYFEKLLQTPVMSNVPEVEEANKNMNLMRLRLEEFVQRFSEVVRRDLKRKKKNHRPPVVV